MVLVEIKCICFLTGTVAKLLQDYIKINSNKNLYLFMEPIEKEVLTMPFAAHRQAGKFLGGAVGVFDVIIACVHYSLFTERKIYAQSSC